MRTSGLLRLLATQLRAIQAIVLKTRLIIKVLHEFLHAARQGLHAPRPLPVCSSTHLIERASSLPCIRPCFIRAT